MFTPLRRRPLPRCPLGCRLVHRHHALAREARASSFHFSGCGLPTFSWLSSTSSVGGATPGGKGISAEGDGRGGRQSGRTARREIRWRERDSCATDRRRGGYPRAIRRRRCLGAVRRPSQSRPSRSSRLSPVCSGVRRPASSKTRLRFAANRRQRRTIVYEVIPEPPSRARRHSVAREPRRSSRPDVRRAFNPRVSSISAPAHRTHQVRR